jgi:hypothetical protein
MGEAPHHRADLVVQEGARGGRDPDLVADPGHIQAIERAQRAVRLAIGGAEGCEVVVPDQNLRRLVHEPVVHRPGHVPDPVRLQSCRWATVQNPVEVVPLRRRDARVERIRDQFG